jgi:3-hydroxyacyl-[acyl-carrier-protein] dehydratase
MTAPKTVAGTSSAPSRHVRFANDPRAVASAGSGVTPVPLQDGRQMNEARPAGLRLADLDAAAINRLIPHRYPFLMIDRVVEVFADTSAIGIKNVTVNEPFFPGHFPGHPIMPGVLIVEAMAQTAAALVAASVGAAAEGKLVYFTTIEQARFRRPVVPGDQLRIKVIKQQKKLGIWKFVGLASVEDKTAAEAIISAKIMDPPAS